MLLADPLMQACPGLAAVVATGGEADLATLRRLSVIHRERGRQGPADPQERAGAAFRRAWPKKYQ